ncbi:MULTISPECIES: DUF2715 domain-containing protein [unclassified Treponema]|uniref:DUF2715 domain-containing protein n=1 Tax=unclassified Treponema TaxID=2638727 RepID=UPI0020A35EB7|nr:MULTISPECIES: DUF2715 domain-containing protein [unclassified Treponema]UTC67149.1 DUF2715 domain-containing protein [Treponema sp. OMZ 789]UTC69879.1 DUF2715 domain-containing protein [Treponema sp. OMZ 790]UTC72594.1 DUF2715 domain-containing protein [Treponema sp. OMZ 791]
MKKIILIIAALSCMVSLTAFDFMDISGDVGLGYMNYTIVNKYDNSKVIELLSDDLKALLGGEGTLRIRDIKAKDIYNALVLGLSLKMSYVYTNINVGFPFKEIPTGFDPLAQKLKDKGVTDSIKGSVIFDGQLGVGITLMEKSPVNIFLGGGFGINYVRMTRNLPKDFLSGTNVDSLKEIRSIGMFGLGADIGIKYFILPKVGLCLDIKDTIYFLPLANKRFYRGTARGIPFDYSINKEAAGELNIKKMIKSTWANNFTIRLGVALKL